MLKDGFFIFKRKEREEKLHFSTLKKWGSVPRCVNVIKRKMGGDFRWGFLLVEHGRMRMDRCM